MSKTQVGVRIAEHVEAGITAMAEDFDESATKATERAVERGLQEMGYLEADKTPLQVVAHEMTRFAMYSAIVVLGLALATRLNGLFSAGTALFLIGMFSFSIEVNEPEITQRLRRLKA